MSVRSCGPDLLACCNPRTDGNACHVKVELNSNANLKKMSREYLKYKNKTCTHESETENICTMGSENYKRFNDAKNYLDTCVNARQKWLDKWYKEECKECDGNNRNHVRHIGFLQNASEECNRKRLTILRNKYDGLASIGVPIKDNIANRDPDYWTSKQIDNVLESYKTVLPRYMDIYNEIRRRMNHIQTLKTGKEKKNPKRRLNKYIKQSERKTIVTNIGRHADVDDVILKIRRVMNLAVDGGRLKTRKKRKLRGKIRSKYRKKRFTKNRKNRKNRKKSKKHKK